MLEDASARGDSGSPYQMFTKGVFKEGIQVRLWEGSSRMTSPWEALLDSLWWVKAWPLVT